MAGHRPDHHPLAEFAKEREIFEWTRDLIRLRKQNAALKYGTTVTLWSDDLVYAFLRLATRDVALRDYQRRIRKKCRCHCSWT